MTTKRELFNELKRELEENPQAGRERFDFRARNEAELRQLERSLKSALHRQQMPALIDDNFGYWNVESEEDIEFYTQVQRDSVLKTCEGCGGEFRLRPEYGYCNSCADRREQGWDF